MRHLAIEMNIFDQIQRGLVDRFVDAIDVLEEDEGVPALFGWLSYHSVLLDNAVTYGSELRENTIK